MEGELVRADSSSLSIGDVWKRTEVPFDEVQEIWQKKPSGRFHGGVLGPGLIFGLGLGILGGLATREMSCRSCAGRNWSIVGGGLVFGVFGFFIGSTLGQALVRGEYRWDRIYPEE